MKVEVGLDNFVDGVGMNYECSVLEFGVQCTVGKLV